MCIEIVCGELIGDVRRGTQIFPGRVTQKIRLLNAPDALIHLAEHPDNAISETRLSKSISFDILPSLRDTMRYIKFDIKLKQILSYALSIKLLPLNV